MKTPPFQRLCPGCLADALNNHGKAAKVILFQEGHRCDDCTRTTGVFICRTYCPVEKILTTPKTEHAKTAL